MNEFVPGLFEVAADGSVHLIAGRRRSDGRMHFPVPRGSEAAGYEPVVLPDEGTLWSFTVQRFRPKTPPYAADDAERFEPFVVGYVELHGAVIVESRIETADLDQLRIGMRVRAGTMLFRTAAGREGLMYTFRPISEELRA